MAVRTLDAGATGQRAAGPETALFFPPSTTERRDERDARERRAKAICVQCPVRRECLDYALGVGEIHGIWGGLNETERRGPQGDQLQLTRPRQRRCERRAGDPDVAAAAGDALAVEVLEQRHHVLPRGRRAGRARRPR